MFYDKFAYNITLCVVYMHVLFMICLGCTQKLDETWEVSTFFFLNSIFLCLEYSGGHNLLNLIAKFDSCSKEHTKFSKLDSI
jgi:hypothetical protein